MSEMNTWMKRVERMKWMNEIDEWSQRMTIVYEIICNDMKWHGLDLWMQCMNGLDRVSHVNGHGMKWEQNLLR